MVAVVIHLIRECTQKHTSCCHVLPGEIVAVIMTPLLACIRFPIVQRFLRLSVDSFSGWSRIKGGLIPNGSTLFLIPLDEKCHRNRGVATACSSTYVFVLRQSPNSFTVNGAFSAMSRCNVRHSRYRRCLVSGGSLTAAWTAVQHL